MENGRTTSAKQILVALVVIAMSRFAPSVSDPAVICFNGCYRRCVPTAAESPCNKLCVRICGDHAWQLLHGNPSAAGNGTADQKRPLLPVGAPPVAFPDVCVDKCDKQCARLKKIKAGACNPMCDEICRADNGITYIPGVHIEGGATKQEATKSMAALKAIAAAAAVERVGSSSKPILP